MYKIITFEPKYRDDMIFNFLSAKDALGRVPRLNEDLLDIEKNYFASGNMFWVALDENDRVVGSIGTNIISSNEMWLKRLFIKPTLKRGGIGSALLKVAENFALDNGISVIHTRFSDDFTEAARFYPAKGFVESERSDGLHHFIKKLTNYKE